MNINVGVSNHHIHLKQSDLNTLFGEGYLLTRKRDLTQLGQYVCEETVSLERNGKRLDNIKIIAPLRSYTQVELLETDNELFGIKAPVRTSGDLAGSEWIDIIGPKGKVHAIESTIVADRHIHMSATDLIKFGVSKGDTVSVKFDSGVVLDDVHIKSDPTCVLEMHMNKDEAIKLGIETGDKLHIC